jgi:hypothetical protein
MLEVVNGFWASLGLLSVTLASATALAYWLFKLFSEKWLAEKFNERLESYKHEQQKALEKLRLQISSTLDRTSKLHQYEFEALPKLWRLTTIAMGETSHLVSPLKSIPDLNRMTKPAMDDFLAKSELAEWEKDEVRASGDKTKLHSDKEFWLKLNKTYQRYYEFNNYLIESSIFMPNDIKLQLKNLGAMMLDALLEAKVEHEHPNPRTGRYEKSRVLRDDGAKLVAAIEVAIKARLQHTAIALD